MFEVAVNSWLLVDLKSLSDIENSYKEFLVLNYYTELVEKEVVQIQINNTNNNANQNNIETNLSANAKKRKRKKKNAQVDNGTNNCNTELNNNEASNNINNNLASVKNVIDKNTLLKKRFEEVEEKERKLFKNHTFKRGIRNSGNLCFLISVAQVLIKTRPFYALIQYLKDKRFPFPLPILSAMFEISLIDPFQVVDNAIKYI